MGMFDKLFRKNKENEPIFEDQFMDLQAGLIELCLEITGGNVDKIYAYASIEQKSQSFNAFFEKDNQILMLHELGLDLDDMKNFLMAGTYDLDNIKMLCEKHKTKCPTEMKMFYEVPTDKYNAEFKYEEICSARTGVSAGTVFENWYEEVKRQGSR